MRRIVAHNGLATESVPLGNVLSVGGSILGISLGIATGRTKSWFPTLDLLLPVAGLLLSLSLQVVLLITGQLRRRTPGAKLPGWVAYVGSDIVAAYTLGLLSRAQQHVGLYGLWAALLVYHLGGPDNFTAYERADSELWKRHGLNLLIQTGSALRIICVDSRGWILVPTLLVFLVGFNRYCERTLALMQSSRGGITEALTRLSKYMENEGEPSPRGRLNYIVAGANLGDSHRYSSITTLGPSTDTSSMLESNRQSNSNLVTTADIEEELDLPDEIAQWAQWLAVASACSSAYLRRVAGLARQEQLHTKGGTRLRSKWFGGSLLLRDWMSYMQLEQDFLYTLLYAKPTNPDGNHPRFMIRVLSSFALVGSLLAVHFLAGDETWQEYFIYQVATNFVLLVGAIVEFGYVLRLFFSKGAVVAMLVHLVKARRANGMKLLLTLEQDVCVWLLRINEWWEATLVMHNKTYLPGSDWEKGSKTQWFSNKLEAYIPGFISSSWDRSWEMVRIATPPGRDCKSLLQKIEKSQGDGVIAVLESIQNLTALPPDKNRREVGIPTDPVPVWRKLDSDISIQEISYFITQLCQQSFWDFYNSDWEHVLLIWWIATLKVLCLQERSLMIGVPVGLQYQPDQLSKVAKVRSSRHWHEAIQPQANEETTQMEALWLMLYIGRLLTVCPELLPTHLDLTKKLVAENVATAREEIRDPSKWVRKTIGARPRERVSTSDVQKTSSQLAVKLMTELDGVKRWEVVKRSGCHFIATLAQSAKLDEHCSKLAHGGELLTTLWILSSHLGGGLQ